MLDVPAGTSGCPHRSQSRCAALHDVEQPHGLPRGVRQRRSGSGKEVRDVLYEDYGTLVELDGAVHGLRRLRDMHRDNGALMAGLVSLRYGWPDVTGSPCQVAWQIAALLVARGWRGHPDPVRAVREGRRPRPLVRLTAVSLE